MSKRGADDSNGSAGAQSSVKRVHFEPHLIGPLSTLDEMDIKILKFQNKKLAQRLEQRVRTEGELRVRIEQLEKRQTQDDAVLNVVNRYWDQLNEDVRILLQRFDAETADELEIKTESPVTSSFLTQLSSWDKEELEETLANRVQVSKHVVSKIVQVIDHVLQRNEKITIAYKRDTNAKPTVGSIAPPYDAGEDMYDPNDSDMYANSDEALKQAHIELMHENRSLQNLNTSLHGQFHTMSLKIKRSQDEVTALVTESAELKNQIHELQYDLEKVHCRNDKLENHLAEAIEKLKTYNQIHGDPSKPTAFTSKAGTSAGVSSQHVEEIQKDLEEFRDLANNRLHELDKLHNTHREKLKEVEKLKMDIRQLPESIIVETTEYKCLQSQFSVLYNESMQIKTMLDETRNQLQTGKNHHARQIEVMECEELNAQKKVRTEMIQMEDTLAHVRMEYDALRIEYEKNMAANEQTAPINIEMRHLINSLQNHNGQLKGEVQRYKRKYKETSGENMKLRKEVGELVAKRECTNQMAMTGDDGRMDSNGAIRDEPSVSVALSGGVGEFLATKDDIEPSIKTEDEPDDDNSKDLKDAIKEEKLPSGNEKKDGQAVTGMCSGDAAGAAGQSAGVIIKMEKYVKDTVKVKELKMAESETVRDLRTQLKKALNDQKEMKLLLDMYKGVSKDQRDKVQMMAVEKKLRSEIEELCLQLKKLQESKREERKKLADEEAMRKIKQLEEQKYELQKQVTSQKTVETWPGGAYKHPFVGSHEEEALLNEMEVTGQAFEDMQEQNSRLVQQLREKDDANFKLMSERINASQLVKLLREENQAIEEMVGTREQQIESMNNVMRKLDDRERSLLATVAAIEKELVLRQQAMEMHKRKAIESAQSAADLKLHLEKYHSQMKEAQQVVAEKTSALEAEAFKTKRLQEEVAQLKRKAERMKKIEMAGTTMDEVMLEEIREYKETLTCPSCKVKRKDAVLSKCFHVFCYVCLRTRYETRQRKCPKCNCAFGANDYHRLYLT